MGVLAWIVIGLVAGWLAAKITNSPRGGLLCTVCVAGHPRRLSDALRGASAVRK